MEVVLRQDVEGLGKRSDVVHVADGYARNFLLPKNLALKPNQANMKQIELEKNEEAKERATELEDLKKLAEKLSLVSCTVPVKVGEEGQMYGSVTPQDLSDALKSEDVDIDPKCITIDTPIKELGVYAFTVRLAPEVETSSKVWVVED
jgi:large subunit ribosomal protein L9